MPTSHFEILVEELSMEAYLHQVLPKVIGETSYSIYTYRGKGDLLQKLLPRLRGYAKWLPDDHKIVVLVDQDDDDCAALKRRLQDAATAAGLRTRTDGPNWQIVNRIAVEELESAELWGSFQCPLETFPAASKHFEAR